LSRAFSRYSALLTSRVVSLPALNCFSIAETQIRFPAYPSKALTFTVLAKCTQFRSTDFDTVNEIQANANILSCLIFVTHTNRLSTMKLHTQLRFQLNALVLLLKHKNYSFVLMSLNFLTATCFDPRGSSSGGTVSVPG
jgi:hypothetical protein